MNGKERMAKLMGGKDNITKECTAISTHSTTMERQLYKHS